MKMLLLRNSGHGVDERSVEHAEHHRHVREHKECGNRYRMCLELLVGGAAAHHKTQLGPGDP